MNSRTASSLVWLGLTVVLSILGWSLITTSFKVYDDEGYVLISLRNFCEGRGLYTEVFSQYGPAFYLYYKGLHALTGLTYDHSVGRLFTLIYWVASGLAAGGLTARLTSSRYAGWAAAGLAFVALAPNINEPFHPGSLLALVSILAAWAGMEGIRLGSARMGVIVGVLGTFALLTKINVGLFILCPWGAWWLLTLSASLRWRRWIGRGVAAAVVAVPLVLMRAHLGQGWALGLAWLFMAGALGTWWLLNLVHTQDAPGVGAPAWPLSVVGAIALVVLGMAAMGTSPAVLWHGAVVAPLSHPNVYTFPAGTSLWGGVGAWISLAALAWTLRQPDGRLRTWIVICVRLAGLALYFWQAGAPLNQGTFIRFAFEWGPLLAGWMLIPLDTIRPRETLARAWLGWFFCWQILQAYPVAGSQAAWGSVLWTVVAITGCVDLGRHLVGRWKRALALAETAVTGAAVAALVVSALCAQAWWRDSLPLGLTGAHWVRPVPDVTRSIRVIDANIRREAGIVFSLPGMFSFNLWSGHPAPTAANTTHWFSLLDAGRQAEIIHALEADPRAVVIVQRDLLRFLIAKGYPPEGMLADYLRIAFIPALRVGSYDLCVKRGRTIKTIDTFRIQNDQLTGRVTGLSSPAPLSLRIHGKTPLELTGVHWTQEPDGLWAVDAKLDEIPPTTVPRLLVATTPSGEIEWVEDTLPTTP